MWGLGALAEASTPRNLEEKFRAGPSEMINLLTRAEWATLIGGHSILKYVGPSNRILSGFTHSSKRKSA
jgi:hypothetical protein